MIIALGCDSRIGQELSLTFVCSFFLCSLYHRPARLIALLMAGLLLSGEVTAADSTAKRLLLIHARGQGDAWAESLSRGVIDGLHASAQNTELYIENADNGRFDGADYAALAQFIARKYQAFPPDVVLVSDANALTFFRQYREQLFPQKPLVFTAGELLGESAVRDLGDAYQVADGADYLGTLSLIKQLFPQASNVAFIGDGRTAEVQRLLDDAVLMAQSEFAHVLDYKDFSLEASLAKLQLLPDNSVVLVSPWIHNANQQLVDPFKLAQQVAALTNAPVFVNYEPMLLPGVLGGPMVTGEKRGKALADVALKLLTLEPGQEVPRSSHVQQSIMLSYAELQRYGLLDSPSVPEQSVIVGRPPTLFDSHPLLIVGGTSVVVLLLLLILLLITALHVRQRMAAKVADNEQHYRHLFEESPSASLVYEPLGLKVLAVNQAFTRVFGYEPADIVGLPVTRLAIAEQLERIEARIAEALLSSGLAKAQWTLQTRDGRRLEVELSGGNAAIGEQSARVVLLRDISQREAVFTALRDSEQRLNQMIAGSPLPTVVIDAQQRVTHWNHALERLTGVAAERVLGQSKNLARMVGLDNVDQFLLQSLLSGCSLESLNRSGRMSVRQSKTLSEGLEADIFIPGRGGRWLHSVAVPLRDTNGSLLGAIETMNDVTALKQASEQLQQLNNELEQRVERRSAELSQANEHLQRAMQQLVQSEKLAALGGLVAGVAHELNTPIGNAVTVASALHEHLDDFQTQVRNDNLRRSQLNTFLSTCIDACQLLERNSARAAELVASFKQVAVDQTSVRRRRFKLLEALQETLRTVSPLYKHEPVTLQLDVAPFIELDSYPGPLEQVITNLVANAVLHGRSDKAPLTISISAESTVIGGQAGVAIAIRDDGVGMSPEVASEVFAPFFTTRVGKGGSGLGLYVVQNLVSGVLGGQIELHTTVGEGACFTLNIPLAAHVWADQ